MKQKLGLCCALIHDPDLLILDEPTTGVDPLSRRQFWELIAHLEEAMAGEQSADTRTGTAAVESAPARPEFTATAAIGAVFFVGALLRFRKTLTIPL